MGLETLNRIGCACAILAMAVSFQAAAQDRPEQQSRHTHSRLIEFDAPDISTMAGFGTQPFANNDEGSIVGYYTDVNLVPHAFLRTRDGKLARLSMRRERALVRDSIKVPSHTPSMTSE